MGMNRRDFVKSSALATAAIGFPNILRAGSPNEEIRIACVGIKGRGTSHIAGHQGQDNVRVVALCDVDEDVLNGRAKSFEKKYDLKVDRVKDLRKLLERDDIDAVSLATPNHQHAIQSIWAAQAGKDVYVEKPVSHNVWEGRQLVNAARKYDRIIQTGTQSRSSPSLKEAAEFVQAGKLGKIQYAVGTCYKPRKSIGKLDKPLDISDSIDYDLWCGPAAKVDLYRPKLHYDWHWDFNTGNGDMGNQGIHQMDIARWFLGEDELSPVIFSLGGRLGYEDAGNTPNTQTVYHGYKNAPLIFETRGLPTSKEAQKSGWKPMDNYRGSRVGVIVQCEDGYVVIPSYTSVKAYDNNGKEIEKWSGGGNHFKNFISAVRSRKKSDLNAEILDGHLSSALCHTGAISHQMGSKMSADQIAAQIKDNALFAESFDRMAKHLEANGVDVETASITAGPMLEMDPKTERFTNNDEANELLTRNYRKPFVVPEINS
ncbi:4-carboxy-2-hydroxymuconate-6-semialdehyde dehydrogenase [Planctomycetes bacterium Pan216]|uniref:4-carboxy-2-hydroxymuconate-6-semialdehyde dehydrogenase n=1 Tax=Kolteria novifilia TaxID=2527975 RepID=A0A518B839_9BACT|nr:4-carboxy-2-hydroxymuconate-6-semialdehyde dehydrogenase [Planctomycetes bacterium Pan216]